MINCMKNADFSVFTAVNVRILLRIAEMLNFNAITNVMRIERIENGSIKI